MKEIKKACAERFLELVCRGGLPSEDEWDELEQEVEGRYPGFRQEMYRGTPLSTNHYRICLLLKCRFYSKEIGALLGYGEKSLSTIKRRLLGRIYGIGGPAKELKRRILEYGAKTSVPGRQGE